MNQWILISLRFSNWLVVRKIAGRTLLCRFTLEILSILRNSSFLSSYIRKVELATEISKVNFSNTIPFLVNIIRASITFLSKKVAGKSWEQVAHVITMAVCYLLFLFERLSAPYFWAASLVRADFFTFSLSIFSFPLLLSALLPVWEPSRHTVDVLNLFYACINMAITNFST